MSENPTILKRTIYVFIAILVVVISVFTYHTVQQTKLQQQEQQVEKPKTLQELTIPELRARQGELDLALSTQKVDEAKAYQYYLDVQSGGVAIRNERSNIDNIIVTKINEASQGLQ